MSEATRSAALMHAVATHGADGHEAVLKAANAFNNFIEGTDSPPGKPAATKPAAAATKPAATKPAATAKKPAESEETIVRKATAKAAAAVEEQEGDTEEVTQEQVETIIADLLGANLRKQAVALLAEFGAKSASGVPEESRSDFLGKAQELLLGA